NKNSKKVLKFYNERREQALGAKPHAGHIALAVLEDKYEVTIITQNVDTLHERAGSSDVIHLHGNLSKARSIKDPSLIVDIGSSPIKVGDTAKDGGQLRPHIVWFGEAVPNMDIAAEMIPDANLLIVAGTSLSVYPAAGLVDYVHKDVSKYLVDPEPPEGLNLTHWNIFQQNAKDGVPKLVSMLLNKE